MVDTSLLITIALIFLVSLIGAYIRTTLKDPCLKSFHDFHVTLERTNGKVIWGVMHLAATGLELRYPDAVQDEKHVESCYILCLRIWRHPNPLSLCRPVVGVG